MIITIVAAFMNKSAWCFRNITRNYSGNSFWVQKTQNTPGRSHLERKWHNWQLTVTLKLTIEHRFTTDKTENDAHSITIQLKNRLIEPICHHDPYKKLPKSTNRWINDITCFIYRLATLFSGATVGKMIYKQKWAYKMPIILFKFWDKSLIKR